MSADDDPTPPPPLRNLGRNCPSARLLRQKVWRRMNIENQHFMGVIVGREGTGKSHTALTLAETVDRDFDVDRVFFEVESLLEAFQSDEYSAGDVVILDEAGVGLGSRSWYEKEQILLNQVLQTVRDDNMGVIFTLPRLSELDSQTRGRLHAFIEMTKLNKRDGYALAKWKRVSPARDDRADIYYPFPEIRSYNGNAHRVESIKICPPPDGLVEAYEQKKGLFKEQLFEEALEAYDDADVGQEMTPQEVADEVIDEGEVERYVSVHPQNKIRYLDADLLKAEYSLSVRKCKTAKKLIEQEVSIDE